VLLVSETGVSANSRGKGLEQGILYYVMVAELYIV